MKLIGVPEDLRGKSVLDVGGYDGRYAAHCLAHGAERAILLDNRQYRKYGWADPEIPAEVEFHEMDFMDWHEPTDLVICYNVIYHVPEPNAALRHLRKLTRWMMLLCTSFVEGHSGWKFYGDLEGHNDPKTARTVYARPTLIGLISSLEMAGFTELRLLRVEGNHLVMEAHGGLPRA